MSEILDKQYSGLLGTKTFTDEVIRESEGDENILDFFFSEDFDFK